MDTKNDGQTPERSTKPFTCVLCNQQKAYMFFEKRTGAKVGRFCVDCGRQITQAATILRVSSVRITADLLARGRTEICVAGKNYEIVPTDRTNAVELTRLERRQINPRRPLGSAKHTIDESPCWGEWEKDNDR